ncbi:MAG: aldehyde dehydrogenase family protein [Syntrophotaleaceae bacterium]
MKIQEKIYIGGEWVSPHGREVIEVVNPATEAVIATIPRGTAEDADAAVRAARKALPGWSSASVEERADRLEKIAAGLNEQAEEIAAAITDEMGMPLKLSKAIQAGLPAANMGIFARELRRFPFEERIGPSLVVKEPVGVVGCITPWNFPLHQIVAKVGPALAAGCTVVLKPSEVAPLDAFILAEIIDRAGLPAGVFNLVPGTGPEVGEALAGHPQVAMISFTGSTRAGRRILELAAKTVKRTALELGGKSPAVILEDADLETAVKSTVSACYLNSGQTCSAMTRLLVPEALYPRAAELAIEAAATFNPGDPRDSKTRLGPLVSAAQRERVRSYISKGLEEGAELLLGGLEPPEGLDKGFFVRPTVFGRVTSDMTIAREEIFGPVLSIMTFRDEEEAIALANDTIYGLAGSVWAGDEERARRVARRLEAGQVEINGAGYNIKAPFGGFKQSGIGRENGRYGLEEFLEIKALLLPEEKTG